MEARRLPVASPPRGPKGLAWFGYYAAAGQWRRRRPDRLRASVVVNGSPRSGTTWLGDLVADLTGWPLMQESTNVQRIPQMEELFAWDGRPYVDPDTADPDLALALERILTGTYLGPGLIFRNQRNDAGLWRRRPLVSKVINLNFLLPWITEAMPWLRVIQIVRHPFEVVVSQHLRSGSYWSTARTLSEPYLNFLDAHPEYATPTAFDSVEETLTTLWAIEHAWLRDQEHRLRGVVWVRYEDLRRDPGAVMASIGETLGVGRPDPSTDLRRPSRVVNLDANTIGAASTDAGWRSQYGDEQLEAMRTILARYDHPFYGPDELA